MPKKKPYISLFSQNSRKKRHSSEKGINTPCKGNEMVYNAHPSAVMQIEIEEQLVWIFTD
ncbi:hypothetical protein XC08_09210 [Acinetobacter baumannii]|nr:hypothetical protein [Acinetobacter baumannii]